MGPEASFPHDIDIDLYQAFCRFLVERDGGLVPGSNELPNRSLPTGAPLPVADVDVEVAETLTRIYVGERYTVDLAFSKGYFRADQVEELISREERFHTELLANAVKALGRAVPNSPPPALLEVLLRGVVQLPHPFSTVLLFCGEYVGVLLLLSVHRRLASGSPAVRAAVGPHVEELLIDEIGHLAYQHARLSRLQLAFSRLLLLPLLVLLSLQEPLVRPLLADRRRLMSWRALDALAGGRAFVPALRGSSPPRQPGALRDPPQSQHALRGDDRDAEPMRQA
jgi:hypothetical protein